MLITWKEYHRKPLTAHCRLLLRPHEYRSPENSADRAYIAAYRKTVGGLGLSWVPPSVWKKRKSDPKFEMTALEKAAISMAAAIVKEFDLRLDIDTPKKPEEFDYQTNGLPDYLFETLPWMDPGETLKFTDIMIKQLSCLSFVDNIR